MGSATGSNLHSFIKLERLRIAHRDLTLSSQDLADNEDHNGNSKETDDHAKDYYITSETPF